MRRSRPSIVALSLKLTMAACVGLCIDGRKASVAREPRQAPPAHAAAPPSRTGEAGDRKTRTRSGDQLQTTRKYTISKPPAELKLNPFYKKYVSAGGYPIVSSQRVNDYALKEAA